MTRKIFTCLFSVGLTAAAFYVAAAQAKPSPSTNPLGPFSESIERRLREQDLRSLPQRLRARRVRTITDPHLIKQMNEDFVRIQTIRAEAVRVIAAGALFDLKKLEKDSDEIRKRASRLRDSLALSEESSRTRPGRRILTIESVNDAVYDLCIEISRFTENPMFKANGVYTVRDAGEASKALDTVIDLAGDTAKAVERLRKSN
ncbi:MAG TPA: hypothetical protein VJ781_03900 [Pyrinomonadaceae bacterium]|nr:hypothetical protein [Pyrinomonadaceae bacterium]